MSDRGKLYAFISPVRKAGLRSFKFSVLQPGGKPPLVLEYNTREQAKAARKQLLTSHHSFPVQTQEFFNALEDVFQVPVEAIVSEGCP